MRQVVRCFLQNDDCKFLLVRHIKSKKWSLPGWHIDKWESIYKALKREIMEELNLKIELIWNKIPLLVENIKEKVLPICAYKIEYESKKYWKVKKLEYIFHAQIKSWEIIIQEDEIEEYRFFSKDEILNLENTFTQIKNILKSLW